jgi:hypothetical protein
VTLYKPNKNVFGQIFKEDRGDTYIMLRFDDYLQMLDVTINVSKEKREYLDNILKGKFT